MMMPGRKFSADGSYRYGFNGKENDNEVKGEGNQQDYGMRIYDPRLGRFLSVDPLVDEYPWNSTYSFAEGNPINYIDLDGAETPAATAQSSFGTSSLPRPSYPGPRRAFTDNLAPRDGRVAFLNGLPYHPDNYHPDGTYKNNFLDQLGNGYKRTRHLYKFTMPSGPVYLNKPGASNAPVTIWGRALIRLQLERAKQFSTFTQWNSNIQANEIITNDPSTLPDDYLTQVDQRIKNGKPSLQDLQYQDEIAKRKKEGRIGGNQVTTEKQTFLKLNNNEITALKEKFGEGEEKFIEKLKTPGGKGAGKFDLYKDEKTGDIYVKPKGQPNAPGEKTEYNVNELNQ